MMYMKSKVLPTVRDLLPTARPTLSALMNRSCVLLTRATGKATDHSQAILLTQASLLNHQQESKLDKASTPHSLQAHPLQEAIAEQEMNGPSELALRTAHANQNGTINAEPMCSCAGRQQHPCCQAVNTRALLAPGAVLQPPISTALLTVHPPQYPVRSRNYASDEHGENTWR